MSKKYMQTDGDQLINHVGKLIGSRNKSLLGKVLTIIDGVVVDERQNKAIKDMITNTFYETSIVPVTNEVIDQFIEKHCPDQKRAIPESIGKAAWFNN